MRIQTTNIPHKTRPPLGVSISRGHLAELKTRDTSPQNPVREGFGVTEKALLSALPVVGSFLPLFEGSRQDTWRALGFSAGAALMNAASSMGLVFGIVTGDPIITGASVAALGTTGYVGSLS